MTENRVKVQSIIKNQLPSFVREDYPLVAEFLTQYYKSQEYQGAPKDLVENIDKYLKLDNNTNLTEQTTLTQDISFFETEIRIDPTSIKGFPETNGLVKIDDEIIHYESLSKSFEGLEYPDTLSGCSRGFSGVTSYQDQENPERLVFSQSSSQEHTLGTPIINLNALFLKEFLKKVKKQFLPGFEERLSDQINQNIFIKQSNDFYTSKGTDQSFEILFRALYGEDVEVIKPRDFLIKPSDAGYRVSIDLVGELVQGDPYELENQTLKQDEYSQYDISAAYGSISKVEKINFIDGEYYKISLDYDYDKDIVVKGSVFGSFSVHPKTTITSETAIGNTFIDVDSTVGFPSSGTLILKDSDGIELSVTYSDKTNTQFLGVDNLSIAFDAGTKISLDVYCYGFSKKDSSEVRLRIRSVISDLVIAGDTYYFSPNEKIRIKSLGIVSEESKANEWFLNIPVRYEFVSITNFVRIDDGTGEYIYTLKTPSKNSLNVGDQIRLSSNSIGSTDAIVIGIIDDTNFTASFTRTLNISDSYSLRKKISKVFSRKYPEIVNYSSNVQNTYLNLNEDILVSSSSLPSYYDSKNPVNIDVFNKSFIIPDGEYNNTEILNIEQEDPAILDHGLYTGDSVYYSGPDNGRFLGLNSGVYFVKRLDGQRIKLSRSRTNLYQNKFITFIGNVSDNKLDYISFYNKSLYPQNILREIKEPVDFGGNIETQPGPIGILINGVEVLNYKTQDSIFYGGITSIDVTSPGTNYDVLNPPELLIDDVVGSGATGTCSVIGSLKRIDLIDPGFDYISNPIVTISGGNGTGATAEVSLKEVEHKVFFNALSGINTTTNSVGFSTFHKFRNGERIIYNNYNQTVVSGLVTSSNYYVSIIDSKNVKLHPSESDALSGINTISLISVGSGIHEFKSYNLKNIIAGINVINEGSGYRNQKRNIVGVNTALDEITTSHHGYQSREKITYYSQGTPIGGLTNNQTYIIDVIDNDTFKLCEVGVGQTSEYFYYENKKYIDITSSGVGTQFFNYPNITVSLTGNIGITTLSDQDLNVFQARIQPIFRGEIDSVNVTSSGSSYGTPEILNFVRQPNFVLNSGKDAELLSVVSDGKIVDVLVLSSGSGYNSPPDLIIGGDGYGAKLTPIISGGKIIAVNIINGGYNYKSGDPISVVPAGQGCNLSANIQKWTVNFVEKNIKNIGNDDGFLEISSNKEEQLQYFHSYVPRKLREAVYSRSIDNVKVTNDLIKNSAGTEINSSNHSPIIGWAYDGNPIYGPYGYSEKSGGTVKLLKSGYVAKENANRPPQTINGELIYPLGFFVEDYEYVGGDLDEHNGRFCKTPDYPNGTYAYFATVDELPSIGGVFNNYKKPKFPYLIGNKFKSSPNSFNFSPLSNQNSIDLNKTDWFRNTSFLRNSYYDYIFDPNNFRNNNSTIKSTSVGNIESVGILTGGNNYKVNDSVIFDNSETGGINANATVERILGKNVSSISIATTYIDNVELIPSGNGKVTAFTEYPHNLNNDNLVIVSGLNTTTSDFYGSYSIGVSSSFYVLDNNISSSSTTGIVTYISLSGDLRFPNIRENDILRLENELVKVLNVDLDQSRLRVIRGYNGTVGASHTATTIAYNDSRVFTFSYKNRNQNLFEINRQLYFNPVESVGLGTTSGVGIGTTISFSNPGVGVTQKFIPTQSIYLPNHNLKTGDSLIYSSGDGTTISVSTNKTVSFSLNDLQTVYAAKISDDLIGISTVKVYLNSNGNFVGVASTSDSILYFTGIGTGVYHSFKTSKNNVLKSKVSKNVVTVSTASTHSLDLKDNVKVSVIPSIETVIVVKYDDYNRRILINPKNISSGDIDVIENTIYIENHGFKNGDKVVYTSTSPAGGLENNKIYYVYSYTKDKIKLCSDRYKVFLNNPIFVNITSTSSGVISPINPPLNVYRNCSIKFDLSDNSLSVVRSLQRYPAFTFDFYKDSNFNFVFDSSKDSSSFEVVKSSGRIGVDANAYVLLNIKDTTPQNLYYDLTPIKNSIVEETEKFEKVIDFEVDSNNKINILGSKYNGSHSISGITSNTFSYDLTEVPEQTSYTNSQASISYDTSSITESGSIVKIRVNNKGLNYKALPGISTVVSQNGTGAILEPVSTSIGGILSYKIDDIGFNYPTDFTLKPLANVPEILKMEQLTSFERIEVLSYGKNYLVPPRIIVIDGFRKNVVNDVILKFDFRRKDLIIEKNTFGISNVDPIFIPINNSNGVGIGSISYNSTTKNVTVKMAVGFSTADTFPFEVGDKVLIENVGITTLGKGYNSSQYNYQLFTLVDVDENIGGIGSVTYNLSDYLSSGEYPGTFNSEITSGRIIAEKDFPSFKASLKKNNFIPGEEIETSRGEFGIVEKWNEKTELLKVSTNRDFFIGDFITGKTSRTQGVIRNKVDFDAYLTLNSDSVVSSGWKYDTGKLNNSIQRVHDNYYYQDFSYSLKSKVSYDTWSSAVDSLNHTSGFLKFSDLVVESSPTVEESITIAENATQTLVDIIEEIDTNCTFNFDLVTETSFSIASDLLSNQIIFNSKTLMDYSESIGNRVLTIDDISPQFNSNPRTTDFSVVDTFDVNFNYKKYFVFVRDRRFTQERQIMAVSLLHDDSVGYLNQYGKLSTYRDLGSFDFNISGNEGQLLYYPIDSSINDYDIGHISYSLNDALEGSNNTSLGDIVSIASTSVAIPVGITTTVVGIASTYRSSKLLLQVNDVDNEIYQTNEISFVFDGSNIVSLEYGELTNDNLLSSSGPGIGTYSVYYNSPTSTVNVDFIPDVGIGVSLIANSLNVSIANTSSVGVGTTILMAGRLDSSITSIASTTAPIAVSISEFEHNVYCSSYSILSIEDLTNNQYRMSEVLSITDGSNSYIAEYGIIETGSGIGTVGIGTDANKVKLYFTPNPNTNVQVRVFQNAVGLKNEEIDNVLIDLTNAQINSEHGEYAGTEKSVRREFDLYHRGNKLFERNFLGNNSNVVNLSDNTIFIPNHFFVTGEELVYTPSSEHAANAIGIATTSFVGVGTTTLLPSSVYAVKVDDVRLKLARSAEDALSESPRTLDFTNLGVGTNHKFTATNQNSRVLITLDNLIQSPIVSTSVTTSLGSTITSFDSRLDFVGITSFYGGDLIKINNEIMKINTVGFGGTNIILVDRPWMGTVALAHSAGSLITKVRGGYNIVDNTIHFIEAPKGKTPIGSVTNPPNERDWTGITTSSKFHGRSFIRSGIQNSTNSTYSTNYIFDDISNQFIATVDDFDLKSNGQNIAGISTDNAIILINSIFQEPQGDQIVIKDYIMEENAGITSITFTGSPASVLSDPNSASVPTGGVIISVGSTGGLGYQPLVSAGATAVVSGLGTISSFGIGTIGSGYRGSSFYEIETTVNYPVGIGSTVIYISNENGVFKKLTLSNTNKISVGDIKNSTIVSIGNTYVTVNVASASTVGIGTTNKAIVRLDDPIAGIVNVGVQTTYNNVNYETFIGFATVISGHISTSITITNPGSGFTSSNPPIVLIDNPLPYSDIPLIYSSSSTLGIGSAALVDIIVGQGSSVTTFEITNTGYAYGQSEILTVPTGGLTGIPTDPNITFREFRLNIERVFYDEFVGWNIGQIQVLDSFEGFFDGSKKVFQLRLNNNPVTIRSKKGSSVNVRDTLLIFINDIIQIPGESYTFSGGSFVTFDEAPKGPISGIPNSGDKCKVIFYRGTSGVDVVDVDVVETVKAGDDLTINANKNTCSNSVNQEERVVTLVESTDSVYTTPYNGVGIINSPTCLRPVTWCKQTKDVIINGKLISKARDLYEPIVNPITNIIQPISSASTQVYVESVKTFFDPNNESIGNVKQKTIEIFSQDNIVGASATVTVSVAGTITNIYISNGGVGYSTSPTVTISSPTGIGTTATATATISGGIVNTITLSDGGSGYSNTNPPLVLVSPPTPKYEKNLCLSYEGDFGVVVGVTTTSVGVASTGLVMDLFIPLNSYLRNSNVTGTASTNISRIQTGQYFVINNSNIGTGFTSLYQSGSVLGIGTQYLDNVYQVADSSIEQRNIPGIGVTFVRRVTVSISSFGSFVGSALTSVYGEFSWGKIDLGPRQDDLSFDCYLTNGYTGLSTSGAVRRLNPLKYKDYTS